MRTVLRAGGAMLAGLGLLVAAACSSNSAPAAQTASGDQSASQTQATAAASRSQAVQTSVSGDLSVSDVVKLAEPAIVRVEVVGGVGSGFIVSDDGYIITNNHVVAAGASSRARAIKVTTSDGADYQATIVGTDSRADLAVLKINATGLQPLKLARLDDIKIGQDVVAIGYALDLKQGEGPSFSVTRGIVSQKNRAISESSPILGAVQTDAAINHGNSGGPLLTLKGEVVGVNTALAPNGTTGDAAAGISFAVGSDTVQAVYDEIRANGKVSRGFLGVQGFEALRPAKARQLGLPDGATGIVLTATDAVAAGGPAASAGLRSGDVITKLADVDLRNESDLAIALIRHHAGEKVTVMFYRDGKQQTATVTLGSPQQ